MEVHGSGYLSPSHGFRPLHQGFSQHKCNNTPGRKRSRSIIETLTARHFTLEIFVPSRVLYQIFSDLRPTSRRVASRRAYVLNLTYHIIDRSYQFSSTSTALALHYCNSDFIEACGLHVLRTSPPRTDTNKSELGYQATPCYKRGHRNVSPFRYEDSGTTYSACNGRLACLTAHPPTSQTWGQGLGEDLSRRRCLDPFTQ